MVTRRLFLNIILWTISTIWGALVFAQTKPTRPNIIVILADDMGYSDLGCFGSEIFTPYLDSIASKGLVMTRFYNASRCCPSRASLITGLYPHQAGVGDMVSARAEPAYQGYLNKQSVTIAEALKGAGYATYMAGKWHLGTAPENWPRRRGFDRYFGLIDGASSYFSTRPYRPNQKLTIALDDAEYNTPKDFYSTNSYTDFALEFLKSPRASTQPFFLYLAYTAPHWPLHALPGDIAKFKNSYSNGWDEMRKARFEKMRVKGILDSNAQLSPRDSSVPAWTSLSTKEQEGWQEKMSVYAAMIYRMDQNIGRILQYLKSSGQADNTLILFLADNGGSNEKISGTGFTPEILDAAMKPASDPASFTAYGPPGANLSNTPFRNFKKSEYEGGTRTPFIAYSPSLIPKARIDNRPAHLIDIMATCIDLSGAKYPVSFQGNKIILGEGISLRPVFSNQQWAGHHTLYFEHEGNRAVRQGEWKLVSAYPEKRWHLFNLKQDPTELKDLAGSESDKLKSMEKLYQAWAFRAGVIPFEKLGKTLKGE